ncbi:NUDIX domain-containing protein [Ruegeria pomeroyi]|uniref:NUDIX domain protein n=2 Tax=Ruegeria pomeroyi TaxID=89184 RepID=Q5LV99_RUEPO|nr:NUDIX domain-containing protein [Ruegeria pomeroyi]HCE72835.1 NUDIX domain-containing protein [Ruegeria sp.]AAV94108.1 NUDIX domain protein [Ruegeria pomeroyi DSS-3]NVK99303.1 NUDIX domain-containing protein [Ruegeria pomeroyi]NVL03823.1 NUDIX domain-containing protein [Ruegeria pomeroyi]QWV07692.1 NUDIX domain-containing protein [Ruegeria pomeroyi]
MPDLAIRAFLASLVAIRSTPTGWQVLLLKRTQTLAGTWCQIAGKIEEGETAWRAALRELEEETGLTPMQLYSADICEQFYEAHRDAITIAPVFVAFVDPDQTVRLNHEHSAHRWVSFEEAAEMVTFGGQRRVLRWVEEEFVKRAPAEQLRIDPAG